MSDARTCPWCPLLADEAAAWRDMHAKADSDNGMDRRQGLREHNRIRRVLGLPPLPQSAA